VNKFAPVSAPVQVLSTPAPDLSTPVLVDPNQISLLDQIADLEADQMDEDVGYAAAEQADNEVVQEGSDFDIDLHQSEEIIEDAIEAEEVPFDIDADDDAVLDSLLTPCAAHDAETVREIEEEKSTDIFPQDETVEYTDPAGNTFEAPIVIDNFQTLEPTPEEHALFEEEEISPWADDDGVDNSLIEPAQDADLSVIEAEDADAFDLDFNESNTTDSDVDFDF
jgi:hypothetical protein